jgi:hypothetical protein
VRRREQAQQLLLQLVVRVESDDELGLELAGVSAEGTSSLL